MWSGGSYTKGNAATGGWTGDASLGIGIEAGRHDTQDNDFATGINQCINKDGSNSFTGNPNLGGFIPTNLAAGTAAAPALCVGNDVNTGIFGPAADTWAVATNGSERLRVTGAGNVGIGTTAPDSALEVATTTTGVGTTGEILSNFANDTLSNEINFRKSRGATVGTNTIVQNGDTVGAIRFWGANGTGYDRVAAILANVDGAPGASNDMPGRLAFFTTADGAGSLSERMRITSAGRVGIGVTSPSAYVEIINGETNAISALNVRSNVAADSGIAALNVVKYANDNTTSNRLITFTINQAAIGQGQINANGASQAAFGSYSDERLKENIVDLPSQLESICNLRPVEFDYKDGSGHQIGFIAQEVQAIYPDIVGENSGYLTLTDMNKNDARLIKAFQELYDKVKALDERVELLEA
jgi:hypothetical protein